MDLLTIILEPVAGAVSLAGVIGMLSVVVRWRARRRLVRCWKCWRCKDFFESRGRPRPLCLCNGCLAKYLQEVA